MTRLRRHPTKETPHMRLSILLVLLALALVPAAGSATGQSTIVVLKSGSNPAAVAQSLGLQPTYVYTHALSGFAAPVPDAALTALRADPRVAYVEPDSTMHVYTTEQNAT